jgi:hypothetical protein
MEKHRGIFNQMVIAIFLAVSVIALSAITFNYAGKIQLTFGSDGLQLQIDGGEKTP